LSPLCRCRSSASRQWRHGRGGRRSVDARWPLYIHRNTQCPIRACLLIENAADRRVTALYAKPPQFTSHTGLRSARCWNYNRTRAIPDWKWKLISENMAARACGNSTNDEWRHTGQIIKRGLPTQRWFAVYKAVGDMAFLDRCVHWSIKQGRDGWKTVDTSTQ